MRAGIGFINSLTFKLKFFKNSGELSLLFEADTTPLHFLQEQNLAYEGYYEINKIRFQNGTSNIGEYIISKNYMNRQPLI
ncbi:hypothetical protein [Christiangramia sp.]|uniref:hypothetical protein n=1 Tax=Christiangramia sp. TaxID=1931228 RepID=UPI00260C9847|nr:hypothetical protein [Christiangramia sp.]